MISFIDKESFNKKIINAPDEIVMPMYCGACDGTDRYIDLAEAKAVAICGEVGISTYFNCMVWSALLARKPIVLSLVPAHLLPHVDMLPNATVMPAGEVEIIEQTIKSEFLKRQGSIQDSQQAGTPMLIIVSEHYLNQASKEILTIFTEMAQVGMFLIALDLRVIKDDLKALFQMVIQFRTRDVLLNKGECLVSGERCSIEAIEATDILEMINERG